MLTEDQKRALLGIARAAIHARVLGRRAASTVQPDVNVPLPPADGAFVTIKHRGQLRGCLGTLQCAGGLPVEVARCAADAASEDPRFPPVSPDELAEITLEVSVLGPLEPIDPFDETAIEIGRHGLVVEQGRRRGLLLPQVATEWGWTVEQFLRQTCAKAGLLPDGWRHGAKVYRFDADVFGE